MTRCPLILHLRHIAIAALLALTICAPAQAATTAYVVSCVLIGEPDTLPYTGVGGQALFICPDGYERKLKKVNVISANDVFLASAQTDTFDPVVGGAVFALFFSSVVGLYLLSGSIGLILEAIKKW